MRLGKTRLESKYLAVKYLHEEKNWSINWMCQKIGIARASYYKWLHHEISKQELENIKLAELIKEYDERFNHILGYRRMTSWINHFNHTNYKEKRVHRIMKKLNIHAVIRKKKKKYTALKPETIAENKLGRDFYATAPNEKWATDVTEFKVPGGNKISILVQSWIYMTVIQLDMLLVLETIINWCLKPLTKLSQLTQMQSHYSTVTVDFNTQVKYSKEN